MFCKNCGKQLPDTAMVCDNCGTMVKQTAQMPVSPNPIPPKPEVKNAPEAPEIKTAPVIPDIKTTPVEPEIKTAPVKPEIKTAPAQPEIKTAPVKPEIKTAPVQPEIKTAPVHSEIFEIPHQPHSHLAPEEPAVKTAPVKSEPEMPASDFKPIPPVVAPHDASKPQPPKKRIRKLPILLAAIGVLLVFLLMGKKEKAADPKPEKPGAVSTMPVQEQKEKDRYDSESFLFTHGEFEAIYAELLEENGSPLKLEGDLEKWDNFQRRYMTQDGKPVAYITSKTDPATGKIVQVNAGTVYEDGVTSPTQEQKDAVGLLVQAACGSKAAEMPQLELVAEDDSGQFYMSQNEDVTVYMFVVETDYAIVATIEEVEFETGETEPNEEADLSWPTGGKLFEEGKHFLFTKEQFIAFYQYMLNEENRSLEIGNPYEINTDEYFYDIYSKGEEVGYMIIHQTPSGNVRDIALTFNNEDINNIDSDHMNAGLLMIITAHGEMDEKEWDAFKNTKATASEPDYILYMFELGGMNAQMSVHGIDDTLFFYVDVEKD